MFVHVPKARERVAIVGMLMQLHRAETASSRNDFREAFAVRDRLRHRKALVAEQLPVHEDEGYLHDVVSRRPIWMTNSSAETRNLVVRQRRVILKAGLPLNPPSNARIKVQEMLANTQDRPTERLPNRLSLAL